MALAGVSNSSLSVFKVRRTAVSLVESIKSFTY